MTTGLSKSIKSNHRGQISFHWKYRSNQGYLNERYIYKYYILLNTMKLISFQPKGTMSLKSESMQDGEIISDEMGRIIKVWRRKITFFDGGYRTGITEQMEQFKGTSDCWVLVKDNIGREGWIPFHKIDKIEVLQ